MRAYAKAFGPLSCTCTSMHACEHACVRDMCMRARACAYVCRHRYARVCLSCLCVPLLHMHMCMRTCACEGRYLLTLLLLLKSEAPLLLMPEVSLGLQVASFLLLLLHPVLPLLPCPLLPALHVPLLLAAHLPPSDLLCSCWA
jgi:hypothetical protein